MKIYFQIKTRNQRKIFKQLNKYWNGLTYGKHKLSSSNFYNNKYNFYIERHCIHIWEEEKLTEKELNEIKTMLLLIFKDDNIGSVDISRADEHYSTDLIDIVKSIKNLQIFKPTLSHNNYNKDELKKCHQLILDINKTQENETQIDILNAIITKLIAEKDE